MGEWMLFPRAEEILYERVARGRGIQCCGRKGGVSGFRQDLIDLQVLMHRGDVANLADIEGTDFDVINPDILVYIANTL